MLVERRQLPVMIVRGKNNTLDITLYNTDGTVAPAASGTVDIYYGSTLKVNGAAVTPGSTTTFAYSPSSAETLSDNWLIVWKLDIGEFSQTAYMVRRDFPGGVITDQDLEDAHADIFDFGDDFEAKRNLAWVFIQRRIIMLGKRPELNLDKWAFSNLQVLYTLHLIFREAGKSDTDSPYTDAAVEYKEEFEAEWAILKLRFDEDKDGTANDKRVGVGNVIRFGG